MISFFHALWFNNSSLLHLLLHFFLFLSLGRMRKLELVILCILGEIDLPSIKMMIERRVRVKLSSWEWPILSILFKNKQSFNSRMKKSHCTHETRLLPYNAPVPCAVVALNMSLFLFLLVFYLSVLSCLATQLYFFFSLFDRNFINAFHNSVTNRTERIQLTWVTLSYNFRTTWIIKNTAIFVRRIHAFY